MSLISQYAWHAIAECKQRSQRSVIGWVTISLLSRTFVIRKARLVPAAFVDVNTHESVQNPRGGLWPVLLLYKIYMERL
jgi:hypothetical protein